jgi:hypothetical protein
MEDDEIRDPELGLSESELLKEIYSLEKFGFMFLQEWQMDFYMPDRYSLPSGKILEEKELLNFFNKVRPEFGNLEHIEIRDALYYYKLISSRLYEGQSEGYESFLSKEDLKNCKEKYSAKSP